MKITICSIGSRGDIQPFLLLARALQANGHTVKFSSAGMYAPYAVRYGVDFVPFEGDYERLVDSDEMKKAVGGNPFTIRKNLKEKVYPLIENSLDTFYEVSQWADCVVYHPKTLIDAFGYLFPEKLIKAYVVPAFSPTKAFASPILSGLAIPSCFNRLSHGITNAMINTIKGPVKNFYKKHGLSGKFKLIDSLTIYAISPHFLKRPSDYPPNHYYVGFWFDEGSQEALQTEVIEFLRTSKKKLILTFGSMPYKSKIDINDFISGALNIPDIKILVVRGWGLKRTQIAQNENVLAVDQAPFSRLFPLADAVVHHGGAGTTAIALKAGIPMMICPVLHPVGDQMFWGKKVHEKGLGVKPAALSKLTVRQFVESVEALLTKDFSTATGSLRDKLKKEDGLKAATKLIEGEASEMPVHSS